jgi:hypothetical protein
MGLKSFLFGGSDVPASVTKYGNTATDTPAWYSDYTQGLIGKANAIASEGYQPYNYNRIAGFSDYQKSAFIIAAGLGSWDFKFSLFVLAPIYCFGYYFMLLVTNKSTNEYAP